MKLHSDRPILGMQRLSIIYTLMLSCFNSSRSLSDVVKLNRETCICMYICSRIYCIKEAGNCINAYNLDAKERLRSVSFPVIVLFIDL